MAKETLWVMHVPVLSTAHVASEDTLWLARQSLITTPTSLVFAAPGGWVVVALQVLAVAGSFEVAPKSVLGVASWAAEKGYDWVRLDGLGDTCCELPTYEW